LFRSDRERRDLGKRPVRTMLGLQSQALGLRFLCPRADQLPGLVRHMPPSLARPPEPDDQMHERMRGQSDSGLRRRVL
jgi:hypothetical protein